MEKTIIPFFDSDAHLLIFFSLSQLRKFLLNKYLVLYTDMKDSELLHQFPHHH